MKRIMFDKIVLKNDVLSPFTFLTVDFSTATISHIHIDGSTMRGNLQQTIWTVCEGNVRMKCYGVFLLPAIDVETIQSSFCC